MNFLNFLTKGKDKKPEGKSKASDELELEIDQTIISKTFDEEIKSEGSIETDKRDQSSSKMQKSRRKSSSDSKGDSDSGEYYSDDEEINEKERVMKDYKIVEISNNGACFAHLLFKILGAFCYMFLGFILSSTMNVFLSIFACVLLDFWVTKNITGRKLVGLRWWAFMDEDGDTDYIYESFDYDIVRSQVDKSVFWWGVLCNFGYWGIMFVINIFSFDFLYGLLTFIATSLNYLNIYGYYNCRKAHQEKVSKYLNKMRKKFSRKLIEKLM